MKGPNEKNKCHQIFLSTYVTMRDSTNQCKNHDTLIFSALYMLCVKAQDSMNYTAHSLFSLEKKKCIMLLSHHDV